MSHFKKMASALLKDTEPELRKMGSYVTVGRAFTEPGAPDGSCALGTELFFPWKLYVIHPRGEKPLI